MKVLVMGGMHGNEPLGIEVVRQLRVGKEANIDVMLANVPAIAQNKRFVKADLNRSFPGDIKGVDYETRRAAEIATLCKAYDVVLDFHNTHCPDNDCTFVGSAARPMLYDVAAWLELPRVIVADYDCLNKYAPNCISIEISLSSPRMSIDEWVRDIKKLATMESLPKAKKLELYSFAYRITLEDRDNFGLEKAGLRAFQPLERGIATKMGVTSPAYPIFVADAYTPYNFGGVLRRLNV